MDASVAARTPLKPWECEVPIPTWMFGGPSK